MAGITAVAQYPLIMAALVAIFGVSLIVIGSVWPPGASGNASQSSERQRQFERHAHALEQLQRAGVVGTIGVIDAGDGLGLGTTQAVAEGEMLMTIPEALALDVERARSCPWEGQLFWPLDCQIHRAVVQAVAREEASRLSGLLALLVMEQRRGKVPGLDPSAASAALAVLPEVGWEVENGIFAIDAEEFRMLSAGTSMEGWREAAVNETAQAHSFIQGTLSAKLGEDVTIGEVRWAYLMLHAHGQWVDEDGLDDGLRIPSRVLFLWPLLLARPTPDWAHGVRPRHDPERRVYAITAHGEMQPGQEVLVVDRRLSDASALCFRGLWLSGQHRARLSLEVDGAPRDPQAESILQKHGCAAQPLRLYVQARKGVDPLFMSCMRMLALAGNATRLRRAEKSGWAKAWPETSAVNRQVEAAAAEIAIGALQQALKRLSSSDVEIRQHYGSDPVAARPTVRVREAETMIVVGLLKSMKELQLMSGSEYLFEALREEERSRREAQRSRRNKAGAAAALGTAGRQGSSSAAAGAGAQETSAGTAGAAAL